MLASYFKSSFFIVVMNDDSSNEQKRSHEAGEGPPEVVPKKGRGPSDCLNWDDESDEEEFVPFTQAREFVSREPTKVVFAKKSVAKKPLVKNGRGKKGAGKSSTDKKKSEAKGKSGEPFIELFN